MWPMIDTNREPDDQWVPASVETLTAGNIEAAVAGLRATCAAQGHDLRHAAEGSAVLCARCLGVWSG